MRINKLQGELLPQTKNILALCFIALTAFSGLGFVISLYTNAKVLAATNRRITMAQLTNGNTIYVAPRSANWRDPEVIKQFVSRWVTLSFNWDGTLTGSDQPDEGVQVREGGKVPTNTWFASILLEQQSGQQGTSSFAETSLQQIAEFVPPGVFSGVYRQVIVISYLSEPRQIAPATWEVDMVATRVLINRQDGTSERIPFNRTFTLRTAEIPESPLGADAPPVEQKIYEFRSAGLEITKIVSFNPNNPNNLTSPIPDQPSPQSSSPAS
ncbi:hypothetical protein H6F67_25720 [Microcoleus sp. FACHB-1515]|uniref:hypothetical protein n=1 Tax=Cyanophyceae TaxID=3028117 RepID=UPI001689F58E|nr:hypothetical protein [Microcoleus sp. FACHB-1515]MBD2093247.1 hypothetical protein [Microcoleus sp. FACHB-1515]